MASLTANAEPTKALFIEMLTKDIKLVKAISDLVDNSTDGAKRLRPDGNYKGLKVMIKFDQNNFVISDNCGGIPITIAQHYAFRFGRPDDAQKTKGSIGQFGVGMKRSIFKLGRYFQVESRTSADHFLVEEDVDKWESKKEWEFNIEKISHNKGKLTAPGTRIEVSKLNEVIKENFSLGVFSKELRDVLVADNQMAINQGLEIYLNNKPLHMQPLLLSISNEIQPAFKRIERGTPGEDDYLTVEIIAGIAEKDNKKAGWYIFCNGRLLLEADQTSTTGWGEKAFPDDDENGGKTITPKIHGQFNRFRGFVFFESDNTRLLPWNTTKTGVDQDSQIYKAIRQEMINLMRPVIDFLNKVRDEEKNAEGDEKLPLKEEVQKASSVSVFEVDKKESQFKSPQVKPKQSETKKTSLQKIQYEMDSNKANKVKKFLHAKSWRQVGIDSFNYLYDNEIGDE